VDGQLVVVPEAVVIDHDGAFDPALSRWVRLGAEVKRRQEGVGGGHLVGDHALVRRVVRPATPAAIGPIVVLVGQVDIDDQLAAFPVGVVVEEERMAELPCPHVQVEGALREQQAARRLDVVHVWVTPARYPSGLPVLNEIDFERIIPGRVICEPIDGDRRVGEGHLQDGAGAVLRAGRPRQRE
jgi:hypothetical protein